MGSFCLSMESSMRIPFRQMAYLTGTAVLLAGSPALAADFPMLRGSQIDLPPPQHSNTQSAPDWGGFYFGGFGSLTSIKSDFTDVAPVYSRQVFNGLALAPQGTTLLTLGKSGDDKIAFGGYAGYNLMFGDIMVGVEADYTRSRLKTRIDNSITATYANLVSNTLASTASYEPQGTQTDLTVVGRGRAEIQDFGTVRARFGYAFGNFMPFMTGGVALGRYKTDNNVTQTNTYYNVGQAYNTVNIVGVPTRTTANGGVVRSLPPIFVGTSSAGTPKSGYAVGVAMGVGVEALLTDNIMLRAEYQRIYFGDISNTSVSLDQARVGAAVKF
jgi:outer membrane immunogenic protein